MTAYNLLENKASFLNTGSWSDKAIKEAKLFGAVNELASSKDSNFNYIPKDYSIPTDSDYFHCTSNNTIFGTQIKDFKVGYGNFDNWALCSENDQKKSSEFKNWDGRPVKKVNCIFAAPLLTKYYR